MDAVFLIATALSAGAAVCLRPGALVQFTLVHYALYYGLFLRTGVWTSVPAFMALASAVLAVGILIHNHPARPSAVLAGNRIFVCMALLWGIMGLSALFFGGGARIDYFTGFTLVQMIPFLYVILFADRRFLDDFYFGFVVWFLTFLSIAHFVFGVDFGVLETARGSTAVEMDDYVALGGGSIVNPNTHGIFAALMLSFAAMKVFHERNLLMLPLHLAVMGLALYWLLASASLAAIAGAVFALGIYFAMVRKSAAVVGKYVAGLLCAGAGIYYLISIETTNLAFMRAVQLHQTDLLNYARILWFLDFWRMAPDIWLTGLGPGEWRGQVGAYYAVERMRMAIAHPHNIFLEVGFDIGISGIALLLLAVAFGFRTSIQVIRDRDVPVHTHMVAVGWLLMLFVGMFHGGMGQNKEPGCFLFFTALLSTMNPKCARWRSHLAGWGAAGRDAGPAAERIPAARPLGGGP